MSTFDIADNNLDPDTNENTKSRDSSSGNKPNNLPPLAEVPEDKKEWLNTPSSNFDKAVEMVRQGYSVQDLRSLWMINKENAKLLNEEGQKPAQQTPLIAEVPKKPMVLDPKVTEAIALVKIAGIDKIRFQAWLKETYPNKNMQNSIKNNFDEISNIITNSPNSIINEDGLPF